MDEHCTRTPPRFCPACGAELRDTERATALIPVGPPFGPHGVQEVDPGVIWGWDTYCASCDWSGDISPDEEFVDAEE